MRRLNRVFVEGEVHAFPENHQFTLCGLDKRGNGRTNDRVDCSDCIDKARAAAIRDADGMLGLGAYPEFASLHAVS